MEASERTFDNDDKLDRKRYAEFLTTIIENCDNYKRDESSSYVIAIDSPWGTGKTWFIDMWCNELKDNHNLYPIRYNVWENDFWDNAFEPLMYSILNNKLFEHGLDREALKDTGKGIIKSLVAVAKGMALAPIRTLAGDDAANKIDTEVIGNFKAFLTGKTDLFKEYREFKGSIDLLKKALSSFIDIVGEGKKLVIIIDELDRCKPTFAIQTLEIVKHIFDVKDLIFVFALDMQQLSHSIRAVYGEGIDATGYLIRFFDYISKMPKNSEESFARKLALDKPLLQSDFSKDFQTALIDLSEFYSLSLRDIDIIYQNFLILEKYELINYAAFDAYKLYLSLLVFKYKKPDLFHKYLISSQSIKLDGDEFMGISSELDELIGRRKKFKDLRIHRLGGMDFTPSVSISDVSNTGTITLASGSNIKGLHVDMFVNICGCVFYNELQMWNEIKNFPIAEYLHRKLEMFDFSYLQDEEKKEQA